MKSFSEGSRGYLGARLLYLLPVSCGIATYGFYQNQLSFEAEVFAILTVGTAGFTLLVNLHKRKSPFGKGSDKENESGN